jgi:hypothetical protein
MRRKTIRSTKLSKSTPSRIRIPEQRRMRREMRKKKRKLTLTSSLVMLPNLRSSLKKIEMIRQTKKRNQEWI